jgi:hypothetical protein
MILFLYLSAYEIFGYIGTDSIWTNESWNYVSNLASKGITRFGQETCRWGSIEISEASGYDWSHLDVQISEVESSASNASMFVTLWCCSTWGTERDCSSGKPSSKPKSFYTSKYQSWVQTAVERYDYDGISDMSGLKRAHLDYQIEDEAQNHGNVWQSSTDCSTGKEKNYDQIGDNDGTCETGEQCIDDMYDQQECSGYEYGETLKLAYNGAKAANSNVRIWSFSFNPGDYFDNNPASPNPSDAGGRYTFANYVFNNYGSYMYGVAINCNYDYTGVKPFITHVKTNWAKGKPVVCSDASSMPMLGKCIYQSCNKYQGKCSHDYQVTCTSDLNCGSGNYCLGTDNDILNILDNGTNCTPKPSCENKYIAIAKWAEREKSKMVVKKTLIAKALDVDIFFQFMMNNDTSIRDPWVHSGWMSHGYAYQIFGPIGTVRSVGYTAQDLLAEMTGDTDEHPISAGTNPYSWDWIYQISSSVYVVWNDSSSTIDMSSYFSDNTVCVSEIITSLDDNHNPIKPEAKVYSKSAVPADDIPKYVYLCPDNIPPSPPTIY